VLNVAGRKINSLNCVRNFKTLTGNILSKVVLKIFIFTEILRLNLHFLEISVQLAY
jgi:hypothetical protein